MMAALILDIKQLVKCEDIVKIAQKAAEAILKVYNSKVGHMEGLASPKRCKQLVI